MVKSELAVRLNEKFPDLKNNDVELVLDCILGQMVDTLVHGERIEIPSFGSFSLRHRPYRLARNPKTGKSVALPDKVAMRFKLGKEIRDRVNIPCGKPPKPW
jgi:integration host factor subunit beta